MLSNKGEAFTYVPKWLKGKTELVLTVMCGQVADTVPSWDTMSCGIRCRRRFGCGGDTWGVRSTGKMLDAGSCVCAAYSMQHGALVGVTINPRGLACFATPSAAFGSVCRTYRRRQDPSGT